MTLASEASWPGIRDTRQFLARFVVFIRDTNELLVNSFVIRGILCPVLSAPIRRIVLPGVGCLRRVHRGIRKVQEFLLNLASFFRRSGAASKAPVEGALACAAIFT